MISAIETATFTPTWATAYSWLMINRQKCARIVGLVTVKKAPISKSHAAAHPL